MGRLDTFMTLISAMLNKVGAYLVLPAMTAMMTLDVFLRYVFNAPLSWGLEASQHLLLILFALGMLEAFRSGAHIRMALVYRLLPGAGKRLVTFCYAVLACGVFTALAYKGAEEALFQKNINEVTQYIHLPRWLFSAMVSAVAGLVVLFFILRAVQVLSGQREVVEDGGGHYGGHE